MTIETSDDARGSGEQLTPCPFTTIPAGTPLQIEKGAAGKRRKGSSFVLGTREGKHILIDMPYEGAAPLFSTHTKEKVVVRFFMQGTVFGFSTRVCAVNFHPFGYAVCEFPKFVQKLSVRHHKRLQCSLPTQVKLLLPPDSAHRPACEPEEQELAAIPLSATAIDLAVGGCRLAVPVLTNEIQAEELKYQQEKQAKAAREPEAADKEEEAPPQEDEDCEEGEAPELSPLEKWAETGNIEMEQVALYKPKILTDRFSVGRHASPHIELAFPSGTYIENTKAEIRWSNSEDQHIAVGIKFENLTEEMEDRINDFLAFVEKYFAPNVIAG